MAKLKTFDEAMAAARQSAQVKRAMGAEYFASSNFMKDAIQAGTEKRIKTLVGGSKAIDSKARTYLQGEKFDAAQAETKTQSVKAPKRTRKSASKAVTQPVTENAPQA